MIDLFFRPFMGGIFFDRNLGTSSRLLEFVLRTLALGSNCLPEKGIGAVADQLAARLPADSIHLSKHPAWHLQPCNLLLRRVHACMVRARCESFLADPLPFVILINKL